MNAREIPQDKLPWPIQKYEQTTPRGEPMVYGGFGWEGSSVDACISADSLDGMRFCHEQGFIDSSTKTFFNTPLRAYCEGLRELADGSEVMRAPKCAALLESLGYPA